MEPKFLIFFAVLAFGVPLGIAACLALPKLRGFLVILMVWATAEPDLTGINFLSREFYRAMTRGIEISLADLCALSLAGAMMLDTKIKARWFPPLTLAFGAYLGMAMLGWLTAESSLPVPEAAALVPYPVFETSLYPAFEIFKIFRGFVFFWVLYQFLRTEDGMRVLGLALALTTCYLAFLVLRDRYVFGVNRVKATLGHPNTLATYMAMMATIQFAIALASRRWVESMAALIPCGLAALCVLMTISRGGLMAMAAGMGLAFMLLISRNVTVKNGVLVMIGTVAATIMLAMAADTLMNRFFGEQDAEEDLAYRGLYNEQAKLMSSEHPFGIGAGNFSAYSWDRYAEMVDPELPPGTPPHNLWFLTLGEMGYGGLIALILLWLRFYQMAIPFAMFGKCGRFHTMAVAGTCATLACHLQNALQLGFRQSPLYFLNHVCLAMVVAAISSDAVWSRRLRA